LATRGEGGAADAGGVEKTGGSMMDAGEVDGAGEFRGGAGSITTGEDVLALAFSFTFSLAVSLLLLLALEGGIYGCELSELVGEASLEEVSLGVSIAATEAGFEAGVVKVFSGVALLFAVELVLVFIPASFCFASSAIILPRSCQWV